MSLFYSWAKWLPCKYTIPVYGNTWCTEYMGHTRMIHRDSAWAAKGHASPHQSCKYKMSVYPDPIPVLVVNIVYTSSSHVNNSLDLDLFTFNTLPTATSYYQTKCQQYSIFNYISLGQRPCQHFIFMEHYVFKSDPTPNFASLRQIR